ncbi:Kelch domain-containing protein 8B [Triplophysa tibetana]|uniref:Kelch domain-containing protein 8B n=1 Tax=Triplophysa tibetana TaxID=1572043 RepID=A0A5A9NEY3_9TELE|nr:Kelch domain-containing protein 8B [Triplophysa tibetana]
MPIPEMALSPGKSLYWEVFPPMATHRVYCTPVLWAGRLYVLGGCSENGLPLDSAEVLDLESQRWCELPPLPTARAGASAVAVGDQLMVMGGMDAQQSPLASVEVYHPDEGKWERKTGLGQASMGITTLEKGVQAADKMSEQTNMCLLCGYHHNCEDDVVYMCACV